MPNCIVSVYVSHVLLVRMWFRIYMYNMYGTYTSVSFPASLNQQCWCFGLRTIIFSSTDTFKIILLGMQKCSYVACSYIAMILLYCLFGVMHQRVLP